MDPSRIIKKYPNRRLYDTSIGAYITLDDVKNLVLQRVDFEIIDAKTKKNLTQNTLLQIITEQEGSTTPLFTTTMLQDFIRFYHQKSQRAFSEYLAQAMQLFLQQKEFFNNQWQLYQKSFSDPDFMQQFLKMQKSATATSSPLKSKPRKKNNK